MGGKSSRGDNDGCELTEGEMRAGSVSDGSRSLHQEWDATCAQDASATRVLYVPWNHGLRDITIECLIQYIGAEVAG